MRINNVQIWNLETRQKITEISATGVDVPVAASPDGKTAAYIAQNLPNSTIQLVDLASGTGAGQIREHAEFHMSGLSFNPKGDLLVAASESELVGWDIPSGGLRFASKQGKIHDLSNFFDNGSKLALAEDGQIVIWDVAGGKAIKQLPCTDSGFQAKIAVSNDGRLIAVKRSDWKIGIWSLTEGLKLDHYLETNGAHGGSVRFLPDGKTVVFAASGVGPDARAQGREMMCLGNSETGKTTWGLVGPTSTVSSFALSESGQVLAAGCDDKSIYVWDIPAVP
jgi:WD40 repeat protein